MATTTDEKMQQYLAACGELVNEYQQAIELSELDGKTIRWEMGKALVIKDTKSNVLPVNVFRPYFYTIRTESLPPPPPAHPKDTPLTYIVVTPRHSKSAVVRFERPGLGFVTFNISTNPDNIPVGLKHVPLFKKNDLTIALPKSQLVKFEAEIDTVSELVATGLEVQLVSVDAVNTRAVILGRLTADAATLQIISDKKEEISFKFEVQDPKNASPSRVPVELHEDFAIANYTPMPVEKPQQKGCF